MTRTRKAIPILLITGALLAIGKTATAQQPASPLSGWSGTWRGTMLNDPAIPNVGAVDVTMEIGVPPAKAGDCTPWRTTYREGGTVRQVKDYKLCQANDSGEWYIDEGDATHLTARWLGGTLVSPFKVDSFLITATYRLSNDILTMEIITVNDRPAISGVLPLAPRSIQRVEFKRQAR